MVLFADGAGSLPAPSGAKIGNMKECS